MLTSSRSYDLIFCHLLGNKDRATYFKPVRAMSAGGSAFRLPTFTTPV